MQSVSHELPIELQQSSLGVAIKAPTAFRWNIAEQRCWWSSGLFRLLGYASGEIEPSLAALLERQHHDDRDKMEQALKQLNTDGQPFVFEHRVITRAGQLRRVILLARAAVDASGRPHLITGTFVEITGALRVTEGSTQLIAKAHTELERLNARIESLNLINQATGVLMERHQIAAQEAHMLLRRNSQLAGRKLVWVASELLFTGSLPPC